MAKAFFARHGLGDTNLSIRSRLVEFGRPFLRRHPRLRSIYRFANTQSDLVRHSIAPVLPQIIQPDPREIYITLTANCNLRCIGCRYGRDFMPGAQLPLPIVLGVLEDCKQFGIRSVRLYGGEPLLHPDITRIVEHSSSLGLNTWLTTNGILLKRKIKELHQAGLRAISIGFYGTEEDYNWYVQRRDRYIQLEDAIAYTRNQFGMGIRLTLGWVLMRPTCSIDAVRKMWRFAEKYSTPVGVSLIHYSLPYFTEGPDRQLQFRPEDRPAIDEVVGELLRLKQLRPDLIEQSNTALRSIPDWLLKGPRMRVPCDRYRLIWVGADGTVQLCYVTFRLGNLHEKRLSHMLFSPEHYNAAVSAFKLQCPNCHCSYHHRVEAHVPSRLRYGFPAHDPSPARGYGATADQT